jgi:hypothetical protein
MTRIIIVSAMLWALVSALASAANETEKQEDSQTWQTVFDVNKADLADSGRNEYFILEPGYRLYYTHDKENLTITVLNETKIVDGVKTRVVEERETKNGQLTEVSRNYYAIDTKSKAVYYFGEDVNTYKDGKVVGHEGAWLAGANNKFGLMMPGKPKAGDKFYQEIAPDVAMDRSEILSITEEMTTPAGTYKNCLHVKDGSKLESGTSDKWYAPGIGLIKDASLLLVKVETPAK